MKSSSWALQVSMIVRPNCGKMYGVRACHTIAVYNISSSICTCNICGLRDTYTLSFFILVSKIYYSFSI
jgi:hypothetical protein